MCANSCRSSSGPQPRRWWRGACDRRRENSGQRAEHEQHEPGQQRLVRGAVDERLAGLFPGLDIADPAEARAHLVEPADADRARARQPQQPAVEECAKLSGLIEEIALGGVQLRELCDLRHERILKLDVEIATCSDEFLERGTHVWSRLRFALLYGGSENPVRHAAGVSERAARLLGLQSFETCVDDCLIAFPDAPLPVAQ